MTDLFRTTLTTLTACIGLSEPDPEKDIISLKIDEQECHITEHPKGYLLMFSTLGSIEDQDKVELLKLNMFNQETTAPHLGYDEENDHIIVWNRQSLNEANRENAYNQLEILTQFYDNLVKNKKEVSQELQGKVLSGESQSYTTQSKKPVFPRF